jgi:hypothetical protein
VSYRKLFDNEMRDHQERAQREAAVTARAEDYRAQLRAAAEAAGWTHQIGPRLGYAGEGYVTLRVAHLPDGRWVTERLEILGDYSASLVRPIEPKPNKG